MKHIPLKQLAILTALLWAFQLSAQNYTRQKAIPFVKNYSPDYYNAHEQNFDITQDQQGNMYFANFAGLLQFNGQDAQLIPMKSGMRVLATDCSNSGQVFAGGLYDFGYIRNDEFRHARFVSLVPDDKNMTDVGIISHVNCLGDSTFFLSKNSLFLLQDTVLTEIPLENEAQSGFVIKNHYYVFFKVSEKEGVPKGLNKFTNGRFKAIINASANPPIDIELMFEIPGKDSIFAGTSKQGFYSLVNDTLKAIKPEVNEFAIKNTLTAGTVAGDNYFAVGTLSGGVVITDHNGNILQEINSESKMENEAVNQVFIDKSGLIWIATDYGISSVDLNRNISYLDNETTLLDGRITQINEMNGTLYLASNEGLFYMHNGRMKKNQNLDQACHDFLVFDDFLVAATTKGLFFADSSRAQASDIKAFSFSLQHSRAQTRHFYVGQTNQFLICKITESNQIQTTETIKAVSGNIIRIAEDSKNRLVFLENSIGEVFVYNIDTKQTKAIKGQTDVVSLKIMSGANGPFFSSEKGLFKYNTEKSELEKFEINHKNGTVNWLGHILFLPDGNFVYTDGAGKNLSLFDNTQKRIIQTPFLPFKNFAVKKLYFDEKRNNLIIGGIKSVLMYNYDIQAEQRIIFEPYFTSIIDINKDTTMILRSAEAIGKIPYSSNSLEFHFTSPHYPIVGQIEFRSFLQGFDKDTTEWSTQNSRQFTNLPDKKYKLVIQSKNEYGKIIGSASYDFEIATPLYRQLWAIILYVLLAAAAVKLFLDMRMRAAEKEKNILEAIVKERTEEIEKSKEEIEAQRDTAYKQRKEIIDSINYAQRIQRAVLPSDDAIDSMLGDHFIFFKPYEIVSGDFFWMKKIKNFVAVAAADCTGHGVPGAFMSMLGSSFLNELVTSRSLDDAAEILNKLRSKIKKSLHQEGKFEEQKDGMDISFYLLDSETLELQYSGAYNPLYIIRRKDNFSTKELEEIQNNPSMKLFENESDKTDNFIKNPQFDYYLLELKANRQPIGIYIKETDFSNTRFKLKKDDALYNFSDGYIDQFGGETGSKFKSKRFKELLLSVQNKSMDEQKQILEQYFYRWKGNLAQIDDVIIIGYRV